MCDGPEAYCQAQPKARKAHHCYECHGIIPAGEVYHKHSGVWDHQGRTFKVCADCEALRLEVDTGARHDELTPFGSLGEYASEKCPEFARRFVGIMRRRRGQIHPSWERLEAELSKPS